MPDGNEIDQLKTYMEENYLFSFGDDAEVTDNLLELGIIDSYGFVELIAYIETTYAIAISGPDMESPLLVSYSGLVQFVAEKLGKSV